MQKKIRCIKCRVCNANVSTHPELVLAVLGPLVEGPVVVEAADVVYAVEALNPLRHALELRHIGDV